MAVVPCCGCADAADSSDEGEDEYDSADEPLTDEEYGSADEQLDEQEWGAGANALNPDEHIPMQDETRRWAAAGGAWAGAAALGAGRGWKHADCDAGAACVSLPMPRRDAWGTC